MKRILCLVCAVILLSGCGAQDTLDRAMALRQRITESGCTFDAVITADYGDTQQSFSLQCQADTDGSLTFSVLQPTSIVGITGTISQSEGKLTFDDKAVAFPLLAEGQLSPVSGPWIMLKALRGGYLSSCCEENGLFRLSIDDSYAEVSMGLEIWFDENSCVTYCEVYWQGRMLLSMNVENFEYV